ncbi:hypothetical protein HGRIS_002521 [Hohenbuehelia grisea]|uniref:Uncharacterized protein n=1 Tax=Hohenbuehelia grisea TaxID=104357 RepID=A0ABR3JKQ1_9AGAR
MHAISHSLAHRAPPATRRVRWQPYNPMSTSSSSMSSSRSSPASYLNTPSSVTSSPSPALQQLHEHDRYCNPTSTLPPTPKETTARDVNKQKFITGLVGTCTKCFLAFSALIASAMVVDQAVKSLGEIWHPQDIPSVFLTTSRATTAPSSSTSTVTTTHERLHPALKRNIQLPSPISPTTQQSPPPSSASHSSGLHAHSSRGSESTMSALHPNHSLVPIQGFVREVLRRSQSTGCVLQTALCYIEAIRSRVPTLVIQEKAGCGVKGEPEPRSRVVQPDETDDFADHMTDLLESHCAQQNLVPTVRMTDSVSFEQSSMAEIQGIGKKLSEPATPLPPLPPLPSPLLCPRRTFLASLILATKFTKDKCFSNRAWAKISGLSPREIGRCERALGDALEWRLWVGKVPVPAAPQVPLQGASVHRPVARSRSEGSILVSDTRAGFLAQPETQRSTIVSTGSSANRGLRRCATLPSEIFDTPPTLVHAYPSEYPSVGTWAANHVGWNNEEPLRQSHVSLSYLDSSPTLMTPTLTNSPSSTESSSGGDRTIQMSFIDDAPTPSEFGSATCGAAFSWTDSLKAVPDGMVPPVGFFSASDRPWLEPTGPNTGAFGQSVYVTPQDMWAATPSRVGAFTAQVENGYQAVTKNVPSFVDLNQGFCDQLSFRPNA